MTVSHSPSPHAIVTLGDGGAGSLRLEGKVTPIRGTDLDDARARVIKIITERAAQSGTPIMMTSTDPAGTFTVKVSPDGGIVESDTPISPPDPNDAASAPEDSPTPPSTQSGTRPALTPVPSVRSESQSPAKIQQLRPAPEQPEITTPTRSEKDLVVHAEPGVHPMTRAEIKAQALQESLLDAITNEAPARNGLRGALNTLGLKLGPSRSERGARDDVAAVAQHWPRPMTIAVVNGKGGACKTPTTILLAATFARYGGAGVVAWDNNTTRGTLGWRTQQGPHDATIEDLLPHVDDLIAPAAQASAMASFTHHQRVDRYDVLRSRPEALSTSQPSDAASVGSVHKVLTKYYRLVFVDSGNDESTPAWQEMIRRADAIVVPTITRPEHGESARLLLAELHRAGGRSEHLANNALVVVSQASRNEPTPQNDVERFRRMARAAVGIPYDPAMAGRPLILDSLNPGTRRAWLAASAALTGALSGAGE